jgi:hypothetical protein
MNAETKMRVWWEAYKAALTGIATNRFTTLEGGCELAAQFALEAAKAYERVCGTASDRLQPEWTGVSRIELMGHRSYLGRVREIELYGCRIGEVQELNVDGTYGKIHQFGGRALHTSSPMTEAEALAELRPERTVWCANCSNKVGVFNWGAPEYQAKRLICDKCKASAHCLSCGKPATCKDEDGDPSCEACKESHALPFEVGEVHGPDLCTDGGTHRWYRVKEADNPGHPAAAEYNEWLQCNGGDGCQAWAEIEEPIEPDSDEYADID